MECIKLLKELNKRKVQGYTYLMVKELTEREITEIQDCGFYIKKTSNGYQIHE